MELRGTNAVFTSTEANWIQGLYHHKELTVLRQRILIARRTHAALYVPAMGAARRSLLETPGNLNALLDLDHERAALREVEAQHGVAADGHERHIIAVDLHDPYRQLLLEAAEFEQEFSQQRINEIHRAAAIVRNQAAAAPFEPSGAMDPVVERQVYDMLQPSTQFHRTMEAGEVADHLATISVTAGIISVIQGTVAPPGGAAPGGGSAG